MRTTELASAIAPHLPHRIVGIRSGEKLHEIMVPEDDARSTVELDDRYVILPSHNPEKRAAYLADGARPLPEGFSYTSDKNEERLEMAALRALLADKS
jgi:UDP-N-acetylglucosamine 4,6-dehydratase